MKLTQEFAQAPVVGCKRVAKTDNAGSHAKVYFTKHMMQSISSNYTT